MARWGWRVRDPGEEEGRSYEGHDGWAKGEECEACLVTRSRSAQNRVSFKGAAAPKAQVLIKTDLDLNLSSGFPL